MCVCVCLCVTVRHTHTHSECNRLARNSNQGFDTRMDYVIWRSCWNGAVCFGSFSSYKSLLACKVEVGESNMSFHCRCTFLSPPNSKRFPVRRCHPCALACVQRPCSICLRSPEAQERGIKKGRGSIRILFSSLSPTASLSPHRVSESAPSPFKDQSWFAVTRAAWHNDTIC